MCSLSCGMTSEGRPYARFRRALEIRSVLQAESAARELGRPGLMDALDYLALLSQEAPERFERPARRWLSRLFAESDALTLDEAALAVACLRSFPLPGNVDELREVLRALISRRHGTRGR